MDRLITLEDISLCPTEINTGSQQSSKYAYGIKDSLDSTESLPIFTSPMECIVSKDNCSTYSKSGIRPILPATEELEVRLDACQYIFCAFSIQEIIDNFIQRKRGSSNIFRICINELNGHSTAIFDIAVQLKRIYGSQVNLMGGNIGNSKTYIDYCKAGFDYVRVGINTGSLIDRDKFGFYYPLASLLIEIMGIKNTSCVGLKHPKIIADGGILYPTDIVKCLALGADYVMGGRMFARLLEASGKIYNRKSEEISKNSLDKLNKSTFSELGLQRIYYGLEPESRTDKVAIKQTLKTWLVQLYETFSYSFTMSNSSNWTEFKKNIKYVKI